jgi:hypothetical protein
MRTYRAVDFFPGGGVRGCFQHTTQYSGLCLSVTEAKKEMPQITRQQWK